MPEPLMQVAVSPSFSVKAGVPPVYKSQGM
jgi:hypothetical protein